MKIFNRSLYIIVLTLLVLALMPNISKAQNPLTAAQRNIVIYRTDSIINLYKRYSTFVEDAGNYSRNYAAQFVKLFSDKSMLFNDIDPGLKTPVTATTPLYGLNPAGYVSFVESNYPKGIGIADFFEEKRSEPVAANKGKEYEIIVSGQKKIETFTVDDKLFTRDFQNYEIRLSCNSDLTNFKISTITITGHTLGQPPPPADVATVTILNSQGKPVEGASVLLTIDGIDVAKKISKADGTVSFKQLPKGKEVTIYGLNSEDSTSVSLSKKYADFIKGNVALKLAKNEISSMNIKIVNAANLQPVAGAIVLYQFKGKTNSSSTNENGIIQVPGLAIGSMFYIISIEKEGYLSIEKKIVVELKNLSEETVMISEIPDEKSIGFMLGGGVNRPFTDKIEGQTWSMEPGYGIGVSYNYFPKSFKKETFDLGAYGSITFIKSKFTGSCGTFTGEYAYTDIELDECILNVSANNISDMYNTSSVNLGFGVVFSKNVGRIFKVILSAGPAISISTGSSLEITPDTKIDYAGMYPQYYNVMLDNIPRLGYIQETTPSLASNSVTAIKKMNFGVNAEASVSYEINKQISAAAGVFCRSILTNMISSESNGEISYLINNAADNSTATDYRGLLNTQDKFSQTLLGIQLGLIYKIQ